MEFKCSADRIQDFTDNPILGVFPMDPPNNDWKTKTAKLSRLKLWAQTNRQQIKSERGQTRLNMATNINARFLDCIRAPPRRGRYWEIHPRRRVFDTQPFALGRC